MSGYSGYEPGSNPGATEYSDQNPLPWVTDPPQDGPPPAAQSSDATAGNYNDNNDNGGLGQPGPSKGSSLSPNAWSSAPGTDDVSYNPGAGQDSANTQSWSSGGDSGPDSLTTSSNAVSLPQNTEWQFWSWEQILESVLGLPMPDRADILRGRWTGMESGSSADSGLFEIMSITTEGSVWSGKSTTYIYLSPGFTLNSQSGPSPWLVYENGPSQILSTLTPASSGLDSAGNSKLQCDPLEWVPAIQLLMNAENFYMNAVDNLSTVTEGLSKDGNKFKGQAGGAFAQLMQNFMTQVNSAESQMGLSSSLTTNKPLLYLPGILTISGAPTQLSYSGQLLQAGKALSDFLTGIYNAWAWWTHMTPYSPLGAILQALIEAQVFLLNGNTISINPKVDLTAVPVPGLGNKSLLDDSTWVAIENLAKRYWIDTLNTYLDLPGQAALTNLVNLYYQAVDRLQPLRAPKPTQIGVGDYGAGNNPNGPPFNLNVPNDLLGGLFPNGWLDGLIPNGLLDGLIPNDLLNNLIPNDLLNNLIPNDLLGGLIPNDLLSGLFPNSLFGGAGSPNGGIGGLGGDNPVYASLGQRYLNEGANASVGGHPFYASSGPPLNQDLSSGAAGPGLNAQSPLVQALDTNAGTQDALQSALTSGQVAPGSALQGTLNSALNGADQTQAALEQAAGAGTTANSALQSALADNAATQAALSQALNSGQVQAGTPLASTLKSALKSANQTQAALNQAVGAAAGPSSTQAEALRTALGDNSQAQHELSQALAQVPASSPLHSTIASALTDAGKTQADINQALKSGTGTTTSSLNQALQDNAATQKALKAALASGQVPASGPLRDDLNQALADSNKTAAALHQALAQQGILTEPNSNALASAVGVPGLAVGGAPLASAILPSAGTTAQAGPVLSSGLSAPGAVAEGSPFPMYSPMAGAGMMGGRGMGGQDQVQERERSTWLAEDEDVWGTDPEVGPRVLGRGYTDDEEPEEYDGYTKRPERPARNRPSRRTPGTGNGNWGHRGG